MKNSGKTLDPFKQSEQWLKAILESDADGVLITDAASGKFCYCNDRICQMLGYSPDEILALGISDIHPAEELSRVQAQIQRQPGKDTAPAAGVSVKRKDGGFFYADIRFFPAASDGKKYAAGFFREAAPRSHAENELFMLRREYQNIFDSSAAMIWYKDAKNNFIRVNHAASAAMGRPVSEIEGRSAYELFPEGADKYFQDDLEVIKSGSPKLGIVEEMRTSGGEKRWVLTDKVPYRDEKGAITGVVVFTTDINDRVQTERALRESEERYRSVVDNIGIGVSLIGPGMEILSLNRQMLTWFPHVVLGDKPLCYRTFNTPPRETHCSYCPTILTLRDGKVHESVTETPTPSGVVNYRVISSPIKNAEGAVTAAIEMVEDITARKRMEAEKAELQAQLMQAGKMSAVGQLASGVAHEINNPLGVILGFSQSVLKKFKENESLAVPLQSIVREALRCKDLVQNLLVFSRAQKNNQGAMIDLNAALASALSLIQASTKTCNVELVREFRDDLPKIYADMFQLQQVLINLANNAVEAMPKGGTLSVRTAFSDKRPGYVAIEVRDTGAGIPKELQAKIFEPFFTTKEVGKGPGLGLALAYEIVRKHHGTIEMSSEEGKGTSFTISLPIQRPVA
ncbi:MAG: hypothetical protein A2X28_09695 [Elusimicrobia bacterium GWA2_56_46]|nr:MAG: hypothetical protein A2X28_09695 [Elusimicrobia bacterium GWA2_56_46]OGR54086.1 MAG: hypothetical protein A2X39_03300 [Elusimicrobia bacterium GWC2_56_31]HBB67695.1 hypothetical protein [Elusimicrobiota bacterium]HBW22970.1 hypothetical protein [Elusimicrobiota bacterium]